MTSIPIPMRAAVRVWQRRGPPTLLRHRMWKTHAAALQAENRQNYLHTEGLRLQLWQTQLANISTQATLLLGFAIGAFGTQIFPYIGSDQSEFCLYKDAVRMGVGAAFLMSNTLCCSLCLLVVVFTTHLIAKSQDAYLHVGGTVAVWRTAQIAKTIFAWYAAALHCFVVAAILCIWLFVGMPLWVTANENDAEIVTDDGRYLTRCFSHKSDERHIERDQFGLWNGIANTIVFCMCSFYGKWKQSQVERAFLSDELIDETHVHAIEEQGNSVRVLRRDRLRAELALDSARATARACVKQSRLDASAGGSGAVQHSKRRVELAATKLCDIRRELSAATQTKIAMRRDNQRLRVRMVDQVTDFLHELTTNDSVSHAKHDLAAPCRSISSALMVAGRKSSAKGPGCTAGKAAPAKWPPSNPAASSTVGDVFPSAGEFDEDSTG